MVAEGDEDEASRAFSATNGVDGVLVLHGFTGSPRSMRPLAEAFANAGFRVELPVLPGHGTTPAELAETSYSDWVQAADEEFLALASACERVIVAGLSMGGALACELAARHPEVAGIILVNPFVEPPAASFLALLGQALATGQRSFPSIGSDIARAGPSGGGYDETPIAPLLSLAEALQDFAGRLGEVTCPVLLFSSRVDHVVPPSGGDFVEGHVAGPFERVFLEHSFHVATLDEDASELEARAVAFAQKVTAA
ncbi:MAG TPA: alpha/beta fold hydrolase [Acidimicrobiales bacterium]|nr:alpha/beta fold hydrolase [Acidimicrobiales bacterium]